MSIHSVLTGCWAYNRHQNTRRWLTAGPSSTDNGPAVSQRFVSVLMTGLFSPRFENALRQCHWQRTAISSTGPPRSACWRPVRRPPTRTTKMERTRRNWWKNSHQKRPPHHVDWARSSFSDDEAVPRQSHASPVLRHIRPPPTPPTRSRSPMPSAANRQRLRATSEGATKCSACCENWRVLPFNDMTTWVKSHVAQSTNFPW